MRNNASLLLLCALAALVACIPESTGIDNTFEIREVRIDTVRISGSNDTVSMADTSWKKAVVVSYRTGSPDCFAFDRASLTRAGDTFYVEIREKAYTRRTCIDTEIKELRQIPLTGPLLPGTYGIFANHLSGDTLKYHFAIIE